MLPGLIGMHGPVIGPNSTMREVVRALNLETGLKLILDAGDFNSYPGSGTTWFDVSGNGYDFVPHSVGPGSWTFTGVAGGQSSAETWQASVGAIANQEYDSANETWMNNLHKNNAVFTFVRWSKFSSGAPDASASLLTSRTSGIANSIGMQWENAPSTAVMVLRVYNGTDAQLQTISSGLTATVNQWMFQGVSINEAAGTALFRLNGSTASVSGTYSAPSASNSTDRLNFHLEEGPMANSAIWEGVALTADQITALYDATRAKFGL